MGARVTAEPGQLFAQLDQRLENPEAGAELASRPARSDAGPPS